MTLEVVTKEVSELTEDEYSRCRRLNFGHIGMMRGELQNQRYTPTRSRKSAKVVLVREGDFLIGWSLVFPEPYERGYSAYFYVRTTHRNKGIGTTLLAEAKKIDSRPRVYPHDPLSAGLFKKLPVRCSAGDRQIYLRKSA